jgi:LruC domain-containing protein
MNYFQRFLNLSSIALATALAFSSSPVFADANTPASFVYSPSEGNFSQFMVEDLYPTKGDHDFNDALVAIHQAISLNSEGKALGVMVHMKVIASGARLTNNIALRLPIAPADILAFKNQANGVADIESATMISAWASETDATYTLITDTNAEFSTSNIVNTRSTLVTEDATEYRYTFNFTSPQTLDTSAAPFDIFLYRVRGDGTYIEVHLTDYAGTSKAYDFTGMFDDGSSASRHFVDTSGVPFALLLPAETAYPKEGEAIDSLFPNIVTFGSSAGTSATDFYLSPTSGKRYSASSGKTIPTGDFLGFSSGNEQCLPASDICDLESTRTDAWCIPSVAACDVSNPPVCGASCDADLTLACPSECTGGCSAGVCTIDCTGKDGCKDDTIDCPDGLECFVNCKGDSACSGNTEINCPQTGEACRIDCHKKSSLQRQHGNT